MTTGIHTVDPSTIDLNAQVPGCRPGWTYADAIALGQRLARYRRNRVRAEREYYAERVAKSNG